MTYQEIVKHIEQLAEELAIRIVEIEYEKEFGHGGAVRVN
jgi:ribosomal protein L7Ae-like RNA K-turn-binding protein